MLKIFRNIIPKSSFTRNVLTLMSGTTIAQAIPLAISPILTRIYSPEDFGVLALFNTICVILALLLMAGMKWPLCYQNIKKMLVFY